MKKLTRKCKHDRINGKTEEKVTINPIRYTHDKTGYTRMSRNACFIIKLIFWQIHRFRILVTLFASVTQSAIQAFKN